jgi:hypothetical protein
MSLFSLLLAIDFCIAIIGWILFVIFGQATVRKLRKNPETKDALGIEYISGWDILNVAQALTFTKKFNKQIKKAPFGTLHADAEVLYEHTTKLDRILARACFIPFMFAAFFGLALCLMDFLGLFKH